MSASTTLPTPARVPGDISMWVFVLGDMVIFTAYFVAYLFDRGRHHDAFLDAQRHLDQSIGMVNTLVLLTSSLFVAWAVQATRAGDVRQAARFVSLGMGCGIVFVLTKAFEWGLEVQAGHGIASHPFFMHYFMMTSIHFLHVLLGLLILGIAHHALRRRAAVPLTLLEAGATYWHMVDFLWIILFALLYLAR